MPSKIKFGFENKTWTEKGIIGFETRGERHFIGTEKLNTELKSIKVILFWHVLCSDVFFNENLIVCFFMSVFSVCLFFYNVRFSQCHWFSLSMLFSQMVWRILKNLILKFKLKWKYRVFISKKSRCVSSVFVLICIRDYNGCVCLAIKCLSLYYLNNLKIIWSGGSCIH